MVGDMIGVVVFYTIKIKTEIEDKNMAFGHENLIEEFKCDPCKNFELAREKTIKDAFRYGMRLKSQMGSGSQGVMVKLFIEEDQGVYPKKRISHELDLGLDNLINNYQKHIGLGPDGLLKSPKKAV